MGIGVDTCHELRQSLTCKSSIIVSTTSMVFPPFRHLTDSGSSYGHRSVGSSHEEVKSPLSRRGQSVGCIIWLINKLKVF